MGFIQKAQAAVNESARAEMQRRRTMPLGIDIGYKHKGYGKVREPSFRQTGFSETQLAYARTPIRCRGVYGSVHPVAEYDTRPSYPPQFPTNTILGNSVGMKRAGV